MMAIGHVSTMRIKRGLFVFMVALGDRKEPRFDWRQLRLNYHRGLRTAQLPHVNSGSTQAYHLSKTFG